MRDLCALSYNVAMNLITRLLYRCLPAPQREALLSTVPHYQRRNLERVLKGQARYQPCFDRTHSLFIHVPKAAGRSVVRGLYDVRSVEHATVEWYQALDSQRYSAYFCFTFVRNPWDRLVSAYTYLCKGGGPSNQEDSEWGQRLLQYTDFDAFVCEWLRTDTAMHHILFTPQHLFLSDRFGNIELDFIGRFENLAEDYRTVAERIPGAGELPHINRSNSTPYTEFYTERSRNIVAEVYARDIELFGYAFDR